MLSIGDVHVFVTDFNLALRFYEDGLGLEVVEREVSRSAAYAVLEFPDGGPALHLFSGAEPWGEGERPELGTKPTIRFDIVTTEFDAALVRLIEHGGRQINEIEEFDGARVVTIADPDGNTFELLQLREEQVADGGE
jgi:predicted enzyme related to lactoylglutathione lyase